MTTTKTRKPRTTSRAKATATPAPEEEPLVGTIVSDETVTIDEPTVTGPDYSTVDGLKAAWHSDMQEMIGAELTKQVSRLRLVRILHTLAHHPDIRKANGTANKTQASLAVGFKRSSSGTVYHKAWEALADAKAPLDPAAGPDARSLAIVAGVFGDANTANRESKARNGSEGKARNAGGTGAGRGGTQEGATDGEGKGAPDTKASTKVTPESLQAALDTLSATFTKYVADQGFTKEQAEGLQGKLQAMSLMVEGATA